MGSNMCRQTIPQLVGLWWLALGSETFLPGIVPFLGFSNLELSTSLDLMIQLGLSRKFQKRGIPYSTMVPFMRKWWDHVEILPSWRFFSDKYSNKNEISRVVSSSWAQPWLTLMLWMMLELAKTYLQLVYRNCQMLMLHDVANFSTSPNSVIYSQVLYLAAM